MQTKAWGWEACRGRDLISFVIKPHRGELLGGISGKEPACQGRRHERRGFDPRVRKILWRRKWQPTPVFLRREIPWTEEPGRLQSLGVTKNPTRLSD